MAGAPLCPHMGEGVQERGFKGPPWAGASSSPPASASAGHLGPALKEFCVSFLSWAEGGGLFSLVL